MGIDFKSLFDRAKINPSDAVKRSVNWFIGKIKGLGKVQPNQVLRGGSNRKDPTIDPNKLDQIDTSCEPERKEPTLNTKKLDQAVTPPPTRHLPRLGVNTLEIGHMYFFQYDAKWKKILPVWDQFPLVLPFNIKKDRFWGLNFHYLNYENRRILLETLLKINNQRITPAVKLQLTWSAIVGAANTMAKETVHEYLFDHVKSKFSWIDPVEWHFSLTLPVERFVDKYGNPVAANKVWK